MNITQADKQADAKHERATSYATMEEMESED